eukprot:TRINITY_DN14936_c0_g1_i4.p1 TRINITY_DN14936_c0_g1~~TRINITY_DN14936_c0_g1_i4.p1  ORF type:complete len:280 (-),score=58.59 TRINITY_DN14936_c0_g1_i4:118-957(-)
MPESEADLLHQLRPARYPGPRLHAGPAGVRTELHNHTDGLPLFVQLHSGRQHWRVLSYEKNLLRVEAGAIERADLFAPSAELSEATMHETVLQPGEALFIPHSAAHAALNLQASHATHTNIVVPSDVRQRRLLHRVCASWKVVRSANSEQRAALCAAIEKVAEDEAAARQRSSAAAQSDKAVQDQHIVTVEFVNKLGRKATLYWKHPLTGKHLQSGVLLPSAPRVFGSHHGHVFVVKSRKYTKSFSVTANNGQRQHFVIESQSVAVSYTHLTLPTKRIV